MPRPAPIGDDRGPFHRSPWMNTMNRCVFALLAALAFALPAHAQRVFEDNALRGELIVKAPPERCSTQAGAPGTGRAHPQPAEPAASLGRTAGTQTGGELHARRHGLVSQRLGAHRRRGAPAALAAHDRGSARLALRPDAAALDQAVSAVASGSKKVFIRTFGCQMNEYDSDKMADVLHAAEGYETTTDAEQADLILFNTCSVREKAQEKVFSDLGRVKHLKARAC
jgi:hypothetical protein